MAVLIAAAIGLNLQQLPVIDRNVPDAWRSVSRWVDSPYEIGTIQRTYGPFLALRELAPRSTVYIPEDTPGNIAGYPSPVKHLYGVAKTRELIYRDYNSADVTADMIDDYVVAHDERYRIAARDGSTQEWALFIDNHGSDDEKLLLVDVHLLDSDIRDEVGL